MDKDKEKSAHEAFGVKPKNRSKLEKSPVTPLLRDMGRLAAGVASVETSSRSQTYLQPSPSPSATGTTRNKYGLPPGCSLMDWIRLGASGKDLTGVGLKAGRLPVTPAELSRHNNESDAWLCIRGRVYNVTAYLPFHPGGPEQLMRGAGTDATALFENIHPWVNYEQILNKCYIGPLKTRVDATPEELFRSEKRSDSLRPDASGSRTSVVEDATREKEPPTLPKADWIQKLDYVTLIFYTGNFSNPLVEAKRLTDSKFIIFLTYNQHFFENQVTFSASVEWPCEFKVNYETGKVECVFRKVKGEIWENFGALKQLWKHKTEVVSENCFSCKVIAKAKVNYNCVLVELERTDGVKAIVPLGRHIQVFGKINESDFTRSYTPVPRALFQSFHNSHDVTDTICLLVKRYPDGNLSRLLGDCKVGDTVSISRPLGSFKLQNIEKRELFIMIAAGTGITPLFSIIFFLLYRRLKKCQKLRLLFFNRTPEDIIFKEQFDELQKEDPRFKIMHILSNADTGWSGLQGHITKPLMESAINEELEDSTYEKKDVFLMGCGPEKFTALTYQICKELEIEDDQSHFFLG